MATLLPSVLFLAGSIDLATCSGLMLVATVVWFAATPFWMGREKTARQYSRYFECGCRPGGYAVRFRAGKNGKTHG